MDYIKKCRNGHDFKQMLKKYNLTVDQYFELRYEWDLLSGDDQMVVLKDEVEISDKPEWIKRSSVGNYECPFCNASVIMNDKPYNFCPNCGASMTE